MTVFPRNSVANSFMPAPPRIPRCLFFLSGTPSPGNRSETVRIVIERISVTHDVTFLYAKERFAEHLPEADSLDHIVIERSCFLGLVTSAVEAYNRETNGFLVGNRGTRLVRQRPREVTVLRAAYPLQTEDRKPNWVSHGNEKAFKRARGAIEHADVGYAVLGGFHSHTGHDGAASLSRTDLDYVADELRRISRDRPERRRRGPGGGVALTRGWPGGVWPVHARRPSRLLKSSWTFAGCRTMSIFRVSSPVSTTIVPILRIRWPNVWWRSTRSSWVYGIICVFLFRIPSSRMILL